MRRLLVTLIAASITAGLLPTPARAQDKASVVQRLRAELARLLKKRPEQLPIDRPVAELGADELTVVEWQMAAEEAFRVHIPEDRLFEKLRETRTRKDLTIASMADAVAAGKPWPPGSRR